jgi:hypothetical protein
MLSDDMIIYDSRVGAALGYLVKKCAILNKWSYIPAELLFPYAPPRYAPTATNPLNRNPGPFARVHFPSFSGRPGLQTIFMLRASWIIDEVIKIVECIKDHNLKCKNVTIPKHRFLEAGLFMIGYDLPNNHDENREKSQKFQGKTSEGNDYPYTTLGRDCEFNACLGGSKIRIEKSTGYQFEIELDEIFNALLWLLARYGTVDFFLLDNSATEVKNGSKKNGLGTALFKTNETFNPPNASCVASLLTNIGVLEWNKMKTGAAFRIKLMPTCVYLSEILNREFTGGMDDTDE